MTDPASLRRAYARDELSEAAASSSWYPQLRRWFDTAAADETVVEPNAIQLATVDDAGNPSVRTVLVKALDERGIVFYTNYHSAKATDLLARPRGAAVFAWLALERQVRLSGPVEKVGANETAAYFTSRPRGSQLGAWASPQSAVVSSRGEVEAAMRAVEARFGTGPIPVPPNWGGYLLRPDAVEFWQGRADRLHDRLRYRLDGSSWVLERLAPVERRVPPRPLVTDPIQSAGGGEQVADLVEVVAARRGLLGALRHQAVDTRPLRHPAFRRMLIGQSTSYIGAMLTEVAVPVQVYDLSHSSLQVGFVGLAGLVPIVGFGLLGGAIADAVDRRLLYIWSSLITWTMTLALLAQVLLSVNSVPLVLALVAIQAAGFATASSARGSITPRIVPRDEIGAANTLNFTSGNFGAVIGPLIAGVLVTQRHGFVYAYGTDALLFTAALYSMLRLPSIPPGELAARAGVRSVLAGLTFIVTRPVLIMSFGIDILAMVLAMPRSLYPAVAAERFHGNVGPLYAAIAIGSLCIGLSGGWISRVRRQGIALTCAVVTWGVCVAVSGLAHQLWLAVVLLAFAGGADLVSGVYRQTILQTYAPDEMRGRMQGVFTAVVAGGPRLGDVRAGVTASLTTATFSWVVGGIACALLAAAAGFAVRPFWNYQRSNSAPPERG